MTQEDYGYEVLDETSVFEPARRTRRDGKALLDKVEAGERVFIANHDPKDLAYWYRRAKARHFHVRMSRGTVVRKDGSQADGTRIERIYPDIKEND